MKDDEVGSHGELINGYSHKAMRKSESESGLAAMVALGFFPPAASHEDERPGFISLCLTPTACPEHGVTKMQRPSSLTCTSAVPEPLPSISKSPTAESVTVEAWVCTIPSALPREHPIVGGAPRQISSLARKKRGIGHNRARFGFCR